MIFKYTKLQIYSLFENHNLNILSQSIPHDTYIYRFSVYEFFVTLIIIYAY